MFRVAKHEPIGPQALSGNIVKVLLNVCLIKFKFIFPHNHKCSFSGLLFFWGQINKL